MDKVEIVYPINWSYKVISKNRELLESSIKEIFLDRAYDLQFSKTSKTNKYTSLELSLVVHSDEDRIFIFDNLKKNKNIIMVI
jgi:putative lipoic acid-binding regulatory protein